MPLNNLALNQAKSSFAPTGGSAGYSATTKPPTAPMRGFGVEELARKAAQRQGPAFSAPPVPITPQLPGAGPAEDTFTREQQERKAQADQAIAATQAAQQMPMQYGQAQQIRAGEYPAMQLPGMAITQTQPAAVSLPGMDISTAQAADVLSAGLPAGMITPVQAPAQVPMGSYLDQLIAGMPEFQGRSTAETLAAGLPAGMTGLVGQMGAQKPGDPIPHSGTPEEQFGSTGYGGEKKYGKKNPEYLYGAAEYNGEGLYYDEDTGELIGAWVKDPATGQTQWKDADDVKAGLKEAPIEPGEGGVPALLAEMEAEKRAYEQGMSNAGEIVDTIYKEDGSVGVYVVVGPQGTYQMTPEEYAEQFGLSGLPPEDAERLMANITGSMDLNVKPDMWSTEKLAEDTLREMLAGEGKADTGEIKKNIWRDVMEGAGKQTAMFAGQGGSGVSGMALSGLGDIWAKGVKAAAGVDLENEKLGLQNKITAMQTALSRKHDEKTAADLKEAQMELMVLSMDDPNAAFTMATEMLILIGEDQLDKDGLAKLQAAVEGLTPFSSEWLKAVIAVVGEYGVDAERLIAENKALKAIIAQKAASKKKKKPGDVGYGQKGSF